MAEEDRQPIVDQDQDQQESENRDVEVKVYKKRWYILIVFSILGILQVRKKPAAGGIFYLL